jgi:hypothetical protein
MNNTQSHTSWHFVRCSDIQTRKLQWVDASTNFIADAVTIARYGRTSTTNG